MEVVFNLNYFTSFGQNVCIVADHEAFGRWNPVGARKMNYIGGGNWRLEFKFSQQEVNDNVVFSYRYILQNGSWSTSEAGPSRFFSLKECAPSVWIEDKWREANSIEVAPHVNSSLFTEVVYGRDKSKVSAAPPPSAFQKKDDFVIVQLHVHAVQVPPHCTLRVCGESTVFGSWDPKKAPSLNDKDFPTWKLTVEVPRSQLPCKYKFVITDQSFGSETWEDSADRYLPLPKQGLAIIYTSFYQQFETRGCGVAVPVFSLRTKKSCGVGEFLDIKELADWASGSGLKLLQLLPINDTSVRNDWRDSYPYSSISVFALHPIYLHLPALVPKDANLLKEIEKNTKLFNEDAQLDYEEVLKFKWEVIRKAYEASKKELFASNDFKEWLKQNEWVPQYSLFCALRDKFSTSDFSQWKEYSTITKEKIAELTASNSQLFDKVGLYYFTQYHLHLQLKEASAYAAMKHVGIKGDIAIGVNPKSVDTWVAPHLFRLDKSTGAPPDFFSDEGQNWGFPTYNWDEMAKDDYGWWRARLRHMAQYFHAFRIDHILGFFRIWEMPSHAVTGLLGRFYPSIPIWRDELLGSNVWDLQRLLAPYVRTHLLQRLFGDLAEEVQQKYFNQVSYGVYEFKTQYDTEKKIAAHHPTVVSNTLTEEQAEKNRFLKQGLFKLIQNVVLLQDNEDPNRFYPRIEMFKTSSFAELPDWQRNSLYSLYVDYFYNRQEGLWASTALQRLPVMINSTKMLCCGEDLGMVPKCVEPVMRQLNILGLRIQRMPDDPKKEFQHPDEYSYMTVCTPSVHDTSTLRAWWEEDRGTSQRFYNQILGQYGGAPFHADEFISSRIIMQHLYSRSMWTVFPIQDLFGLNAKYFSGRDPKNERINIPAIAEHYWRYRMHVNIEDLKTDSQFQGQILQMLKETRRA